MTWMARVTKTAFGHAAGGCVLAALVLGACGGGGSVSGAQADTIKKADAICLDAQDAVGKTLGDDANADMDAIHTAYLKLQAIKPPEENEPTWTLFVANTNNLWLQLLDISQSLDPAVNDRARAQRALTGAQQTNAKIKDLAAKYHMEECSKGFGRT